MSQSKEENRNRKKGILEIIMAKFKECNETSYLQIAVHQLNTLNQCMKSIDQKGPGAFRNRIEYQKFSVAKLFYDKIGLLQFSLDPSVSGYNEYKDKTAPPLDAFGITPDLLESKKIKFCRNIEKGDILHLKVVEESAEECKFLVMNKYNENERVVDYLIYAYMMNPYRLNKLPRTLRINDYVRAAVFGKLKMEGNQFNKLLVTLNNTFVNYRYKDVELGLIFKSDIPFYPEDISNHKSYLSYMKAGKNLDNPQEMIKNMTQLGLDPYKTYSFDKSNDNNKKGKAKEFDSSTIEYLKMEKSMKKVREFEALTLNKWEPRVALPIIEEALRIYPRNDAAFAIRGQMFYRMFIKEGNQEFLRNALKDYKIALEINQYNATAIKLYLTNLLLSAESYKDEGNHEKAAIIEEIIAEYKPICDVSALLGESEEDKKEQSLPGEAQSGVVSMDLS